MIATLGRIYYIVLCFFIGWSYLLCVSVLDQNDLGQTTTSGQVTCRHVTFERHAVFVASAHRRLCRQLVVNIGAISEWGIGASIPEGGGRNSPGA